MKINIPRKATFLAAVITALILFFNTSCKPDEPEPKKYLGKFYIGEMRDYTYFKPGSMWVYECDSTGELDTQVMLKCFTWWISTDYIDYEVLSFQRKSLNEGSLYTDFASGYSIPYEENFKKDGDHLAVEKIHNDMNKRGRNTVFFTPYDTNLTPSGGSGGVTTYKKLLTNYTVNNFTFDTVRVFMARASTSQPKTEHPFFKTLKELTLIEYYFAKNVGIVQLKITGYNTSGNNISKNHNWNLKYYKIVN